MHSYLALIANAIEAWNLAIGKSFLLVPRQPREADRLSCCDSIPDLYSKLHSKMHILSSLSALADVSRQKRFLANLRHPALGDFFNAEDAIAGQDNDVILSYSYWRQHFAGAPDALGRTVRIDGVSRRIIGVMPMGVHFPYADTQFVLPVSFRRDSPTDPWTVFDLQMFGRLADGVTPAQAQDELRRLHGVLLTTFPWRMPDAWASDMTVISLLEAQTGQMRPRLLLLFGAVGLILLIACANVANLMLARATAREREIAMRSALGASGRRLIQQLFSEGVVLGVTAGIVGVAAASASLRILVRLLSRFTRATFCLRSDYQSWSDCSLG